MIFGKPPWKAKNLKQLKELVKLHSGNNLMIPKIPETSVECKDLLRSLLQLSPKKRINWSDFFNHVVFSLEEEEEEINLKRSVMFHTNEDSVEQRFTENKKQVENEVELVNPLNIKLTKKKKPERRKPDKATERLVRKAKQVFTHEKKMIVFIMHTCRKLRNLAKQRDVLDNYSDNMMYVALLLLKKGVKMNERMIESLNKGINWFNIDRFEAFLGTINCKKILKELSKDNLLYMTLLRHLQKKLNEEVGMTTRRSEEIVELTKSKGVAMEVFEEQVKTEARKIFSFYNDNFASFNSGMKREISVGLAHLLLSWRSNDEFKFKTNGVVFDWHKFEQQLSLSFVHQKIKEVTEMFKAEK